MPLSRYGPSELEPFLSVYDTLALAEDKAQQPLYAAKLGQIYGAPTGTGDYTYGRAIGQRSAALKDLALDRTIDRTSRQARIDFQKDADRRRYIANQAELAQRLENARGQAASAFGGAVVQSLGLATAPYRPGGAMHGDFKEALETWHAGQTAGQGQQGGDQASPAQPTAPAPLPPPRGDRQEFIELIGGVYGRLPTVAEWNFFRNNPDWTRTVQTRSGR